MNKAGPYLLLSLVLLVACGRSSKTEEAATTTSEPAPQVQTVRSVRTIVATEGVLTATKTASVNIEPRQESAVASGATGRVEQILKREGQRVEAAEVVIILDDSNASLQAQNAQLALDSARINLSKAERATSEGGSQLELQLRSAQTNYEVIKTQYDEGLELFNAGGLAKNQLDALDAQLSQAEASLLQLQNALAQNQRAGGEDLSLLRLQVSQAQTALQQAQDALNETKIKAPFAGEISEVLTEEGEFVAAGLAAFKLASIDRQLGRFSVPPEDAQGLLAQKEIHFSYQGLDYGATITRSSTAPNNQRLIDITAEIYPSETPIPAGGIAQLSYTTDEGRGMLIPAAAIVADGGLNYVFVAEDAVAKKQAIRVLDEVSGEAAVDGIAAGTRVIYPLSSDLREGAAIRVLE